MLELTILEGRGEAGRGLEKLTYTEIIYKVGTGQWLTEREVIQNGRNVAICYVLYSFPSCHVHID